MYFTLFCFNQISLLRQRRPKIFNLRSFHAVAFIVWRAIEERKTVALILWQLEMWFVEFLNLKFDYQLERKEERKRAKVEEDLFDKRV